MHAPTQPAPQPDSLTIERHHPTRDAEWDEYVRAHPEGSFYHLSSWRQIVASALGKPAFGLTVRDSDGSLRGILPLIRQQGRIVGDRLVSLPFCNHGGPVADDTATVNALYGAAAELRRELGASRLEIRDHEDRGLDWPVRTDKVLMTRLLPASDAALEGELGTKLRSNIRRGLRERPEVRHGGAELVDDFWSVFAVNMHELGTPVLPLTWFRKVINGAPGNVHLVTVRLDGRTVAAAFLIHWRDTVEVPWSASLRDFARRKPNMVLYRECLAWAISQGASTFDFGRSTRDEGTYEFKWHWGARPQPLYWYENGLGAGGRQGARRERFASAWRRLPLWLANAIGPRITANLPW